MRSPSAPSGGGRKKWSTSYSDAESTQAQRKLGATWECTCASSAARSPAAGASGPPRGSRSVRHWRCAGRKQRLGNGGLLVDSRTAQPAHAARRRKGQARPKWLSVSLRLQAAVSAHARLVAAPTSASVVVCACKKVRPRVPVRLSEVHFCSCAGTNEAKDASASFACHNFTAKPGARISHFAARESGPLLTQQWALL